MRDRDAVIVMAKAPRAGLVKTRLRGGLTDLGILSIYQRLLGDTIDKMKAVPGADAFISYAPVDAGDEFERFCLPAFPQVEGDIGKRMHEALARVLGEGYGKAALVGVDIPGLRSDIIQEAFRLLDEHDAVFGPASDGGYYLVALKSPEAGLFQGIAWSTSGVLAAALERARTLGLSTALTEELSDVDTPEDLRHLRHQGG